VSPDGSIVTFGLPEIVMPVDAAAEGSGLNIVATHSGAADGHFYECTNSIVGRIC
jgi:hypothetical protein